MLLRKRFAFDAQEPGLELN